MTPCLGYTVTPADSACSAFIPSPGETEGVREREGRKKSMECKDTDIEE